MITSLKNARVHRARRLRKAAMRERACEFLVEGHRAIREALSAGVALPAIFTEAGEGPPAFPGALEVSPEVMRAISDAVTPAGAVAVAPFVDVAPEVLLDRPLTLALVLAGVRDPGNLGTILRTAWAAGADAVLLGEGTVDPYNPKVVRAAAGATFRVPFARHVDVPFSLGELRSRGLSVVSADPSGRLAYDQVDMTRPCALVFGNEAWGLPPELGAAVDQRAVIPMEGSAESINVAIACALFLFEAARQRRAGGS